MANGTNNFEGGTNGVGLTTGPPNNTGGASGTQFDTIFGVGALFSNSSPFQGAMCMRVAAGAFGAAGWTISSTKVSFQMWWTPEAVATADTHLIRVHNSGGTRLASVHLNSLGFLRVDDATGTAGINTFTTKPTAGTTYRIEVLFVAGTTTSNGRIKVAFYVGNSLTPVDTVYDNAAANVGTAQTFTQIVGGKYTTSPEAHRFDKMGFDTTLTDFIGLPAASPPTVSTPAVQNVSAGAAVSVGVTASSSTGTITGYAWSYLYPSSGGPTLTNPTTATVSFTAGAVGKLYQLQCIVTDSNGLTTTVTTEVRVPSAGDITTLPGAPLVTVGAAWSNVGGASTVGDALADGLDTTYAESPNMSATEVSLRQRLAPSTARSVAQFTVQLFEDTVGASTIRVRLYEGATLRQTWTQAVTGVLLPYPFDVTTPAAISDWGNLALEFAGTAP